MNKRAKGLTHVARVLFALGAMMTSTISMAQLPSPNPPGTSLFVLEDGPVAAQFVGGISALFDNELYLSSPTALGPIFHNHTTLLGTIAPLGSFTAGIELIFRNRVVNTEDNFFTGPGSRNPDGIPHAQVTVLTNDQVAAYENLNGLPPNSLLRGSNNNPVLLVGFEDIFGGGDLDYNDLTYLFNNLSSPVPEPSQTILFLAGLGMIGLLMRRRRA